MSKILAIIITDEIHIDWLSLVLQMCCLQLTPSGRGTIVLEFLEFVVVCLVNEILL